MSSLYSPGSGLLSCEHFFALYVVYQFLGLLGSNPSSPVLLSTVYASGDLSLSPILPCPQPLEDSWSALVEGLRCHGVISLYFLALPPADSSCCLILRETCFCLSRIFSVLLPCTHSVGCHACWEGLMYLERALAVFLFHLSLQELPPCTGRRSSVPQRDLSWQSCLAPSFISTPGTQWRSVGEDSFLGLIDLLFIPIDHTST